jgi:hypothetical protein
LRRLLTTCHRLWKKRWCISGGQCWCLMIQTMDSFRRRHPQYSSCHRPHQSSWCLNRRHRHSVFSFYRFRYSCLYRPTTTVRPTSHRRRQTSFITTSTTRS